MTHLVFHRSTHGCMADPESISLGVLKAHDAMPMNSPGNAAFFLYTDFTTDLCFVYCKWALMQKQRQIFNCNFRIRLFRFAFQPLTQSSLKKTQIKSHEKISFLCYFCEKEI